MPIDKVSFLKSSQEVAGCPKPERPEYAFIGRSNVGKSSLINMLMQRKKLAKISSTPGKTQLINHFSVNDQWYLVDLPGYGYAKVPKGHRKAFEEMIAAYLLSRKNLVNVFVLIDARHEPQRIDLEFMEWLGKNEVAFSMVFTKLDKLKKSEVDKKMSLYEQRMLQDWESMPSRFFTSAINGTGRLELLQFIEGLNESMQGKFRA